MKKGLTALMASVISTMFIIGIFLFVTAFIDWLDLSMESNLIIYFIISFVSAALIVLTNKERK